MKTETINKIVKHLTAIKEANCSISEYEKNNNLSSSFIYAKIVSVKEAKENNTISDKDYDRIISLYESIKSNKSLTKSNDLEETDNRSEVEIVRDEKGKISAYKFEVFIRNKPSLKGSFTRDEMCLIYRLYSSYGSNITQREVSRFFPEFSLYDFKRILRTFNITKASSPFPQHIIEENDKEELLAMQFREKENDFLRSYEAEKTRQLEGQLRKTMKENVDLKDQLNSFSTVLGSIDLSGIKECSSAKILHPEKLNKDLILWLSDMHIGAYTTNYSLYENAYDGNEVENRLNKVFQRILQTANDLGGFDNIIICNLGDSLDGYNCKTARGTDLSQNMNNKDQVKTFIEKMTNFVSNVKMNVPCNHMYYYAVGESNHGGDFEYAANTALCYVLEALGVNTTLFDKSISHFKLREVTYILTHGNDNKNMTRGLPLTINDKTENYINGYLDYNNIYGPVVVAKGDLHQSATTYAKRFVYKSVGSLYGSSDWIQANFGFTKACCDYSIVDEKGSRLDGLVILN